VVHLVISAVVAVVVAGVGLFLGARFLPRGETIAPAVRDEQPWELPAERRLRAADIDDLRLPVALRGYRFAETDLLLDRLADELRERDDEIARLRGGGPVDPAPDATATTAMAPVGDADAADTAAMTPVPAAEVPADDDVD
jgi:hypothetical protein